MSHLQAASLEWGTCGLRREGGEADSEAAILGGSWDLVSKVIGTLIGVIGTRIGVISTLIGVIILVSLFLTLVTKSHDPPSKDTEKLHP